MITYQLFLRNDNVELNTRGSKLCFQAINQVSYQNNYLSPGQTLATWTTMGEFWRLNMQNFLPRLQLNQKYCLQLFYQSEPVDRLYVKVTFYNRYKEQISQIVLKEKTNYFEVPDEIIHYKIELINGGLKSFDFQQLNLFQVADDESEYLLLEDDLTISSFIHPDEENHTLRIVFTEPRLASVNTVDWTKLPQAKNIIEVTNKLALSHFYLVDGQLDERIVQSFNELIKMYEVDKVAFIGYGPISNFASQLYASNIQQVSVKIFAAAGCEVHYPQIYQRIRGFNRFIETAGNKDIHYYGQKKVNQWLPDLNNETMLKICPAWK